MDASDASGRCPACGHELAIFGPTLALGSNDPAHLARLYSPEIADARCEECGASLGIEPTVVIGFDDPSALLVWSPASAPHRDDLLADLREQVGDRGELRSFTSLDGLRQAVAELLHPTIARIEAVLESSERGDLPAHFSANWPALTPSVFAAGMLGLERPGYGLDLAERTGDRATADVLAGVQADVWMIASMVWMAEPQQARLEDVLGRWVDGSTPMYGAVDALNERLEAYGDEDTQWVVHYSQEAARATVHQIASSANPRRGDWADLFVGFELALRTGAWPASSPLIDQEVSEERAAATIDREAAWVAVGSKLSDFTDRDDPESRRQVQVLKEICSKAGHPDLVGALLDE